MQEYRRLGGQFTCGHFFTVTADDKHRNVWPVLADGLQAGKSVQLRQQCIQNHKFKAVRLLGKGGDSLLSISSYNHFIANVMEDFLKELSNQVVVLDDKYVLCSSRCRKCFRVAWWLWRGLPNRMFPGFA